MRYFKVMNRTASPEMFTSLVTVGTLTYQLEKKTTATYPMFIYNELSDFREWQGTDRTLVEVKVDGVDYIDKSHFYQSMNCELSEDIRELIWELIFKIPIKDKGLVTCGLVPIREVGPLGTRVKREVLEQYMKTYPSEDTYLNIEPTN